jgi:integrase
VRAAKIDDFRFHDLRHTFASRLAMEGVDLLAIKERMEESGDGSAVRSPLPGSPPRGD